MMMPLPVKLCPTSYALLERQQIYHLLKVKLASPVDFCVDPNNWVGTFRGLSTEKPLSNFGSRVAAFSDAHLHLYLWRAIREICCHPYI
jgi:hypothetical protein